MIPLNFSVGFFLFDKIPPFGRHSCLEPMSATFAPRPRQFPVFKSVLLGAQE